MAAQTTELFMLSLPCAHEHVAFCMLPVYIDLVTLFHLPTASFLCSECCSPCKHRYLFVSGLSVGLSVCLVCCKLVIGLNTAVAAAAATSQPAQAEHK